MALMPIVWLVVGLVTLIFGAELLVRGASRLAAAAGVSSFVVGLTVVAFGTSAPELGASLGAAFNDNGGLAVGNVIGSNIANICLILGVAALICPIPVRLSLVRREVIQMIAVTVIAMLMMTGTVIPRWCGAVLVAGLFAFVARTYINGKRNPEQAGEMQRAAAELAEEVSTEVKTPIVLNIVLAILGIGLLVFGADKLVGGATSVAQMLRVPDAVIGLTLVALGTSIPELSLSVVAALRKEPDIAIGNVLGSNIFNILCVLGLTTLVSPHPIAVPDGFWSLDAWVLLGAALACVPVMFLGGRITRVEGALLLGLYIVYVGALYALRRG